MNDAPKTDEPNYDSIYENKDNEIIGRCSTPTDEICFHCDHLHAKNCCLYIHDTPDDKARYSRFMRSLETEKIPSQAIPGFPDVISGNFSPFHFKTFSPADPKEFEELLRKQNQIQIPLVYFRQFFYPYALPVNIPIQNLLPHYLQPRPLIAPEIPTTPLQSTFMKIPTYPEQYLSHLIPPQHIAPMTYANVGLPLQSQYDLLYHNALYPHHNIHMAPQKMFGVY